MSDISRLTDIMARLRDPENGCPWDIEQTFETIAPYTIEEAYEVEDAIRQGDMVEFKEELGDLLLQVVFQSQIASEMGLFGLKDVIASISDKMIRRHPHVFGDADIEDAAAQTSAWEAQKERERRAKNGQGNKASVLAGIPLNLPALTRAEKLQKRAARVGFDWPDTQNVFDKIHEELDELKEAHHHSQTHDHREEELGDLLFVISNLARHLKVDPEKALRRANAKFTSRFEYIEAKLAENHRTPKQSNLEEMDQLWNDAKAEEKSPRAII